MERKYDLVVILDPEIPTEEQEKLLTKIKKFITDFDGKLLKEKKWGKSELAYPISKKKVGFFMEFSFSFSPTNIRFLKQKLQAEEKILRYLLVLEEGAFVTAEKKVKSKQRPKEA
ncbi:MAG: 30S ribosomal protein S6 [Microgenomates group bacterium]